MRLKHDATRALAMATCVVQHPTWAIAHVENFADQTLDRIRKPTVPPREMSSACTVLARLGDWSADVISAQLDSSPAVSRAGETVLYGNPDGSNEIVKLVYAWCRLAKPALVVETGVAHGFTTAAILHSLKENHHGKLISIDLPHLHPRAEESIGSAVPHRLRDRWTLRLGPAQSGLRGCARVSYGADLFVQDAAHSYRGQIKEYRIGWSLLREKGLLISDDVDGAFEDFAKEVGRDPHYVDQSPKSRPIGIIQR